MKNLMDLNRRLERKKVNDFIAEKLKRQNKDKEVNEMAINLKKLYESRIEEINTQIKMAVRLKKWDEKSKLEKEKAKLIYRINHR